MATVLGNERSAWAGDPLTLPPLAEWSQKLGQEITASGASGVAVVLFALDPLPAEATDEQRALTTRRAMRTLAFHLRQREASAHLCFVTPEQLAWMLPSTSPAQALDLACRASLALEGVLLKTGEDRTVRATVGAGVVHAPRDGAAAQELLASANDALSHARKSGQSCVARPPSILVRGADKQVVAALSELSAREDLRVLIHEGGEIDAALRAHRPHAVVFDADAPRAELLALGRAVKADAGIPIQVLLAATNGPDPSYLQRAQLIPGATVVLGGRGFEARLTQALGQAVGVKPRRDLRVPLKVELVERDVTAESETLDVSETGARFLLSQPISVGDQLRLTLLLPSGELDVLAQVARRRQNGEQTEVGVRFLAPSEDTLRSLRRLVTEGLDRLAARSGPRPSAEEPVVYELKDVEQRFASAVALSAVSLKIQQGERVAIIGPSGAGKSTLMKLLNTSLRPSTGSIHAFGSELGALSQRELEKLRARIGTVYQQLHLIPQATVFQNVVTGRLGRMSVFRAFLSLLSRKEAEEVALVLDQVGLTHKMYERVERLSGGEQQRVAVARVVYQGPDVIIADEPLASIDPTRSAEIVDLLLRVSVGKTLIVSTHQLEPVLPYFSRVIGVRGGRILFDKNKSEVELDDLAALYESERARGGDTPRAPRRTGDSVPGAQQALAIGASATPGEFVLPRIIPAFLRENDGVALNMTVKDSRDVVADLLARHIDLGFVGARVPHPELTFEPFVNDEIVVIASPRTAGIPDGPLPASVAARLPRVEREEGSATRDVVADHFRNMGVTLDAKAMSLQVGSMGALKAAVDAGIGVAFVSYLSVKEDVASGRFRLVPMANVKISRRIFAVYRKEEGPTPAARKFLAVSRRVEVDAIQAEGAA